MNPLASLDPRDRSLVKVFLVLVFLLIVLLAVFTPRADDDKNLLPGSNLTGKHGAKAAFTLLAESGYQITRWEEPLSNLADHAGPDTVLILANPITQQLEDERAVRAILDKGGRVLATGLSGGQMLPGASITRPLLEQPICQAKPEGIAPLSAVGLVWITPEAHWKTPSPQVRADYTCAGDPVVVEYPYSRGYVVWWADPTPLSNSRISQDQDLELLLNSIGPAQRNGHPTQIFWDESLHGLQRTKWDYTSGPIWPLVQWGFAVLALLVILSYSRRSGPIRPLPEAPRTTPNEFLDALGALYRSAGANTTAVEIAWDRFRTVSSRLAGLRTIPTDAPQLAEALRRRFGALALPMEADLLAAQAACADESLKPRRALAIVQTLHRHEETLREASAARLTTSPRAGAA